MYAFAYNIDDLYNSGRIDLPGIVGIACISFVRYAYMGKVLQQ